VTVPVGESEGAAIEAAGNFAANIASELPAFIPD